MRCPVRTCISSLKLAAASMPLVTLASTERSSAIRAGCGMVSADIQLLARSARMARSGCGSRVGGRAARIKRAVITAPSAISLSLPSVADCALSARAGSANRTGSSEYGGAPASGVRAETGLAGFAGLVALVGLEKAVTRGNLGTEWGRGYIERLSELQGGYL